MRQRSAPRLTARYVFLMGGALVFAAQALANSRLLTSIPELTALTNERSNAGIPVHLQATVLYYDYLFFKLVLTDGHRNLHITGDVNHKEMAIRPGDIVAVDGVTELGGFTLRVYGKRLTLIGHGLLPAAPEKVTLADAINPSRSSAYVESEGRVILVEAGEHFMDDRNLTVVRLQSEDAIVDLSLHAKANVSMRSWLGRRMRFRGISGGVYNARRQGYKFIVYVRSLQDLTFVDAAAAPSVGESSPLPLASLFQFGRKMPALVRTTGVVSYLHSQNGFYIQDGNSGIRVRPAHPVDLAVGDEVEITGRPVWEDLGQSVLSGALVTPLHRRVPLASQRYHLNDLGLPATEALLTNWEAVVMDQASEGWRESLTLRPITHARYELPTFQCVYFRTEDGGYFPKYETGSRVDVRGVLQLEWSPRHYMPVSAQMLLRSPGDISLIAMPPWESRFPWLQLSGLFVLALMGGAAWVWTLRRRVAKQTRDLSRAVSLAEAANRAKSEFIAKVSHEIRTPMNGILGMTEMVLASPLTLDQRSFLETARGSAQILLTIVNDILDFSKIQAGKMTTESIEFNLPRTISGALSPFGSLAFEKGVELSCDLSPGLPVLVLGDPVRTKQIIANLVSNAMKFTESGEVVVSARSIAPPAGDQGGRHEIEVSVRDTGIGIPRERQHLLFQSFTQTDGTMVRRFGGTGLGLAISSRLAQAMGGRMWVESDPGAGSTFFFTMLLKPSPGGDPAPGPEKRLVGKGALVVDDHPTARRLVERSLSDLGMKHRAAKSGAEALEILKSGGERFDFIIADQHMPGMTGLRFLQTAESQGWLRSSRGETKSLLLCSGPPPGDCGVAGRLLLKPVATWELAEALASLLDGPDRTRIPSPGLSKTPPLRQRETLRILVAEDNVDSQKLMAAYMKRGGYEPVLVDNGLEAVAAWESGNFSLILMDGQMPEMDGLQAAACIRARERGGKRSIPIIALTAYAQESDRQKFLSAGMTDYLTKPVAYSDLVTAIERHRAPAA